METLQPKATAIPLAVVPPQPKPGIDPKAASAIPGQISQEEALKGGEGAKIDPFSGGAMAGPAATGNSVSVGSLLEGKIAVDIIDALIPSLIVILFHAFKVVLKKADFQLTAKEKDTLAPVVQKCMDSIHLNFDSPWIVLAVTMAALYGAKIVEKGGVAVLDRKMEENKNAPDPSKEQAKRPATVVPNAPSVEEGAKVVEFKREELRSWNDDDVKIVAIKRRKGPDDARQWLAKNWVKKGGVI